MNSSELNSQKHRLVILLAEAIEEHNDNAIRVNAKRISSLNHKILLAHEALSNTTTNNHTP
jgi:hypothetical protein